MMAATESQLAAALDFYKRESAGANRAFWEAKVDAVYRLPDLTDKQRLDKLSPYFGDGSWPNEGYGSSITSPLQLLMLPGSPGYVDMGVDDDGTLSPQPEVVKSEYLEQLHGHLREAAGGAAFDEPTEFSELLTMVDAITDKDFRRSDAAGLDGTCRELQRQEMSDMLPTQRRWYHDGWSVVTGWRCSLTDSGVTCLFYAQKEQDTAEEQCLQWRVYTRDESEIPDELYFDSIAEFLKYKCQWLSRLPPGWEDAWLGPPVDSEEWQDEYDEDYEEEYDEGEDENDGQDK